MTDDERVRDLQRKLYRKAKEEKSFRFYVLYDKVCLPYVLRESYRRVKANRGAPGVDGVTFKTLEAEGEGEFLEAIRKELVEKNYRPSLVKRVMIPKANGKMRPLGIPTIKDRVVQMACKMIVEPIFEADFQDESYGFRPRRGAKDAVKAIKGHLKAGREQVYDADLSSYFDTIPHGKLLTLMGMRIADRQILHLIKQWLKAPVEEEGKISGGKKSRTGTPQGGVISPLLANIYLNLVDELINRMNRIPEDIRIVRYADDFVLMGREISDRVITKLHEVLERMELTVNSEKTRIVNAAEESFDFLGFTFHKRWSRTERGVKYYHVQASMKAMKTIRANIREYLKSNLHQGKNMVIRNLNWKIRGWLAYFTMPGTTQSWKAADMLKGYLKESLYRYHRRKSQRYNERYSQNAYYIWVDKGLIDPMEHWKAATLKA
jgi:group II intron reverse transcriptase/maturase